MIVEVDGSGGAGTVGAGPTSGPSDFAPDRLSVHRPAFSIRRMESRTLAGRRVGSRVTVLPSIARRRSRKSWRSEIVTVTTVLLSLCLDSRAQPTLSLNGRVKPDTEVSSHAAATVGGGNTATLTEPSPFREPLAVRWREGQPGTIRVEVNLETAPPLQWWLAGSPDRPVPGATQATLQLLRVSAADEGSYFLEADLGAARIRSRSIRAVVYNTDAFEFPVIRWSQIEPFTTRFEVTSKLGPSANWTTPTNLMSASPRYPTNLFVITDPYAASQFYRVSAPTPQRLDPPGRIQGWVIYGASGSQYLIEYTGGYQGWTTWRPLTNLFIGRSPYFFLDRESVADPQRVYRTTVVP